MVIGVVRLRLAWLVPALFITLGVALSDRAVQPASADTACAGERFTDVCSSDWFYPYVVDLSNSGAISGYADGTFRSYNDITRGQIAKMIVNALRWTTYNLPDPTFNDAQPDSPYYGFIERVVDYGVVSGYVCGAAGEPCPGLYFRPSDASTRAQACKIIGLARRVRRTPTVTGTPPPATPSFTPQPSRTPTTPPSPTRTSTAGPTSTPGGPCAVFPPDNIWNRNIAALPTHVMSSNYVASIGLGTALHADFGSGLYNGGPMGIPFVTVPGSQLFVPINFTEYGGESDPGPYPVPTNAPIEGGPNSTGDRHVLVLDSGSCTLYEMYHSYPQPNGSWNAGSGALWHLASHALRPVGWTSADAAGLPILPGLARYDEMASGTIRHALRFTANSTQRAYLWPARHYASNSTDPNLPPMGLRMRLRASVDISGYPTQLRVILQALKDYGMFLADNGSSWFISGAPDDRWDNNILHQINTLHGSDFEAIDESGLMIDPDSGQSR